MGTTSDFLNALELVLEAQCDPEYKAAVAIVQNGSDWLLGLSTATDDRKNKWCFPGGGVKRGEDVKKAAERECWEETGIRCKAVGEPFHLPNKKHVAFVHCKVTSKNQDVNYNSEFTGMGFFSKSQMRHLRLYPNVAKLIDRVT